MIDTTLAVEGNWLSTLLVEEGQTIAAIDVLGTCAMIVETLAVEEMSWSRLLESEVDVIYSITNIS